MPDNSGWPTLTDMTRGFFGGRVSEAVYAEIRQAETEYNEAWPGVSDEEGRQLIQMFNKKKEDILRRAGIIDEQLRGLDAHERATLGIFG